jgi:hypothetical protein
LNSSSHCIYFLEIYRFSCASFFRTYLVVEIINLFLEIFENRIIAIVFSYFSSHILSILQSFFVLDEIQAKSIVMILLELFFRVE